VRGGPIALALLFVVAPTAVADGDPASDTLLVKNVFLPFPPPSADASSALSREVQMS
jgi:hypothetical protein